MNNGRSYTKMCKDLFCVELKKKHFLLKTFFDKMDDYLLIKMGKVPEWSEIILSHRTSQDRG